LINYKKTRKILSVIIKKIITDRIDISYNYANDHHLMDEQCLIDVMLQKTLKYFLNLIQSNNFFFFFVKFFL